MAGRGAEDAAAGEIPVAALFAAATAEHAADRFEQALAGYLAILERDPGHIATLVHVADVYLRYGREADARLVLAHVAKHETGEVLARVAGLAQANLAFAELCLAGGDVELGDRLLARALELWPDDPGLNEAVGQRLADGGDPAGAEAYVSHALARAPARVSAWLKLAELRAARDDTAGALEALLEALEADPGHGETARRAIALVEGLQDDDRKARYLYRLAERIEGDGEALAYIGFKMLADERFEGALAAFARASDLDLDTYETLIGAGTAAYGLGEEAAAEAYWAQGLAAIPHDIGAWLTLADTYAHDLPRAMLRRLVDGAAGLASRDADGLCAVAEAACRLSLHDLAGEIVERALALAPGSARGQRLREALARFKKD
jgi:tetratricopeptide (TPR) repeat protein